MMNKELGEFEITNEELAQIAGGGTDTSSLSIEDRVRLIQTLWQKVPETIRDAIIEALRTHGLKGAHALGEKLINTAHLDWAKPMLDLLK